MQFLPHRADAHKRISKWYPAAHASDKMDFIFDTEFNLAKVVPSPRYI